MFLRRASSCASGVSCNEIIPSWNSSARELEALGHEVRVLLSHLISITFPSTKSLHTSKSRSLWRSVWGWLSCGGGGDVIYEGSCIRHQTSRDLQSLPPTSLDILVPCGQHVEDQPHVEVPVRSQAHRAGYGSHRRSYYPDASIRREVSNGSAGRSFLGPCCSPQSA